MAAAVLTLSWLLLGAMQDWRRREVSHSLVVPALLLGLLWRISGFAAGTWWELGCIFLLTLAGFQRRWVGGADVKVSLAIALISVPLAIWAWAGMVFWAALLRCFYDKSELSRLPGLIGFSVGVAAWLFFHLWI